MKIVVVPERSKTNTKLFVNGELKGISKHKIQDFGTFASYTIKGIDGRCSKVIRIKSKFNGAICAINVVSYGVAGLSIGVSAGIPTNNIGVGVLVGSLVGLAIGGAICPLASWRLPETAIVDMSTCRRNRYKRKRSNRQRRFRRKRRRRRRRKRFRRKIRRYGCTKDTDCKGDRICEDGRCINP